MNLSVLHMLTHLLFTVTSKVDFLTVPICSGGHGGPGRSGTYLGPLGG